MQCLSLSHSKSVLGLILFTLFFSNIWLVSAQELEEMSVETTATSTELQENTDALSPSVEAIGTLVANEGVVEVSVFIQSLTEESVNDVRVGLEVVKRSEEGGGLNTVVDTHVYPETLSLGAADSREFVFDFTPAPHLDGEYLLFLNIRDRNGRVLHWSMVDTVTLTPGEDNLEIILDTCTVQKDDSETAEPLTENLSFSPGQTATFSCQVVSESETDYENVMPVIENYWRSPFGSAVSINITDPLIDISEGYDGKVSFEFTAPATPNFYSANLSLSAGQINWGSEFFRYRVDGDYGYLDTLMVSKEDLRVGTNLPVTLGWTILSENESEDYNVTLDLKDVNLTTCAEDVVQTIGSGSSEVQLSLFVDDRCEPFSEVVLNAYLRDGSDNILDQRSFALTERIDDTVEEVVVAPAKDTNRNTLLIGMGIIALLLIMVVLKLAITLLRRRKQHEEPLS
jgi:hypothetical protein